MNKIKSILCPVDFSKYGNEALHFALQIAEANQASVHLFHVLPQMNNYDFNMTNFVPYVDAWNVEAKRDSKKKLDKMIAEIKAQYPALKLSSETKQSGLTDDVILEAATKKKADLIVLGSHGRKGFNRVLMGSIAESVLRHAKCGVLIYKQKNAK